MTRCIAVLVVVLLVVQEGDALARTRRTKEQQFANTIALAVGVYAKEKKRLPSSWSELSEYVDLTKLGAVPGESVEGAFEFLTTQEGVATSSSMRDGKRIVVVGKKSVRRDEETTALGRYVVVATKDLDVSLEWVSEDASGELLGRRMKPVPSATSRTTVALDLEITNPRGSLLPLEPVCLTVSLSATNWQVEDRMDLSFEVKTPDGRLLLIPLDPLHDLRNDTRTPKPTMVQTKGAYRGDLLLVLWLVPTNGTYDVTHPAVLTREHGKYFIRVMDALSGSSSGEQTFVVVDEKIDVVAEFLGTPEGLRGFFGDTHALLSYRNALQMHGDSKWSRWCAAILGIHMFRVLEQDASSKNTTPEEVKSFLKKAEDISFDSLFDLRMSYVRAALEVRFGRESLAEKLFRHIVERYGDMPGAPEVIQAQRRLDGKANSRQ